MKKIVAINPGSTSTKLAYFEDDTPVLEKSLEFPKPNLSGKVHVLDEYPARMKSILAFLEESGIALNTVDIAVSRGGAPGRVEYGAYVIDRHVIQLLCLNDAPTYHASNLAPILAFFLAKQVGNCPAIFYDAVAADQAGPLAHISGIPGIPRRVGCHNLNARMVGREAAKQLGKEYESCKLVIAHLGGGISVSAHDHGIIEDSVLNDEGPMGPQRAGRVSFIQVMQMCFVEKMSMQDMQRITDSGGLLSYFKADTMIALEKMIADGNEEADLLYQAMAYQVCKAIGEMYTVLRSEADAIVLTGGVAYSRMFTDRIKERVGKMAKILVIPGEREMSALAKGGLRVLNGEEKVKQYTELPEGFQSMEEFIARFKSSRPDLLENQTIQQVLAL
ncbi:MAG: butyrate kinase [Clostridiales Family XIII bacterium]|jgi:butyrate kinase|nr:butyrate kinase [Clostridiales Family XIII bacterium]